MAQFSNSTASRQKKVNITGDTWLHSITKNSKLKFQAGKKAFYFLPQPACASSLKKFKFEPRLLLSA